MKEIPSIRWPPSGLTGWLVRRVAPSDVPPDHPRARTALGEFEGYVSTGLSVLLSLTKAITGWLSGSISLVADALNNLADVGSSLIIALGFRWSQRPRDREHPFGHGRIETVITLLLSMFLLGVALEVARSGVHRLLKPEPVFAPPWLTFVIVLTVAVKTWLALFARRLARATKSQVLEADGWNHTFDILCTLMVVLALLGARIGWLRMDGWCAVGVSLFIAFTGIKYARRAIDTLIGEAPSAEELARIRRLSCRVPGVRGAHDAIVHTYGDTKLISLHIEVDADLSVMAAHDLAERVEKRIADTLGARTIVHVDPVDRSHPAYAEADAAMRGVVEGRSELAGFHDLRVTGRPEAFDLSVDLVAHAGVANEAFPRLLDEVRRVLHERLPASRRIDLGVEAEFASEHERRGVFTRAAASRPREGA